METKKRVMTPADAYQIGSDYIVVGRPITQAADPVAAYHAIRMSGTKTEIKEIDYKNKRRKP